MEEKAYHVKGLGTAILQPDQNNTYTNISIQLSQIKIVKTHITRRNWLPSQIITFLDDPSHPLTIERVLLSIATQETNAWKILKPWQRKQKIKRKIRKFFRALIRW